MVTSTGHTILHLQHCSHQSGTLLPNHPQATHHHPPSCAVSSLLMVPSSLVAGAPVWWLALLRGCLSILMWVPSRGEMPMTDGTAWFGIRSEPGISSIFFAHQASAPTHQCPHYADAPPSKFAGLLPVVCELCRYSYAWCCSLVRAC